jgi:hypothetical protein
VALSEYHKAGEEMEALFVADASHIDSKLLLYTRCPDAKRYLDSTSSNIGALQHTLFVNDSQVSPQRLHVEPSQLRRGGVVQPQRVFSSSFPTADSQKGDSTVDPVDDPKSAPSPWCYQDIVTATSTNAGADHTYGITFDKDRNVYASFQHTNVVLRFYADTFKPMPIDPDFQSKHKHRDHYAFKGTFVQFGEARKHKKSDQGVRSIAAVGDNIWITNEFKDMILVATADTADTVTTISLRNPIGLYYDKGRKTVFVSSRKGQFGGCVYAVDSEKFTIKTHYRTKKFKHPTGIVTYGDTMYVAEQKQSNIHAFSISSGKHLGIVRSDVPGTIEQIMLTE